MKRNQQTIANKASLEGLGIHTGKLVTLTLHPAPENSGIVFKRVDLPGSPEIQASVEEVSSTERATSIGEGSSTVHTIEHLLAALYAFGVTNLLVEIDAPEVPIFDGSSLVYVELLEKVGVVEQEAPRSVITLSHPIAYTRGNVQIVALPAENYQISYTMYYPEQPAVGTQFASYAISKETFIKEIASCRTFALYEELEVLRNKGLIQGGSLDNAVVIKEGNIANPEGLRYPNELARHKLLDIIGDLALLGSDIQAHIIAVRSGHSSNYGLALELHKIFNMEDHNGRLSYTY